MSAKENARPTVGAAGQAAEKDAASKIPHDDYTTYTGPISRLLSHGRENAVPLRHLTAMTKLDGRTVRRLIAEERRSGTTILSDNATGYFLPGNDSERMRFVRSMRSRAKEILDAAEAVERARE